MKRFATLLLLALAGAVGARAQAWSGIIAPARAVDWSVDGVPGGIPSAGWAQCGSPIAPYGTVGVPASPSTINAQIAGCGPNTYVLLNDGTFYLNAGIVMKSNVVLRGSGPHHVFIIFIGIDNCGGIGGVICFMGRNFAYNTPPGATDIANFTGTNATTGTYTNGATSIRLTSIGGSITNGDYIYLDQDDDAAVANGFLVCADKTQTPPCSLEDGAPGRNSGRRSQNQIVKVTAGCSSGCTGAGPFDITITPGLYGLNWASGKNPGAWYPGHNNMLVNSGIEGISIDQTGTPTGNTGGITFFNAAEDWVYNVRSIKAHRNHVWFWQAAHITVLSNYMYDSYNASSQSYGIEAYVSSNNLVANNIFQHITTPIVLGPSVGSAYADNFGIDNFVAQGTFNITQSQMSGCPGACVGTFTYSTVGPTAGYTSINGSFANTLPFSVHGLAGGSQFNCDNSPIANITGNTVSGTFQIAYTTGTNNGPTAETATGLLSNGTLYPTVAYHDAGVNYNIVEQNIGAMLYADVFHGSGNANTLFRNLLTGWEKSKFGARLSGDLRSYQRYQNFLGNVFGDTNFHTAYENYTGCAGCSGNPVFSIGFGGGPDAGVTAVADTQVRSTMYRFGNYDVGTAAVRWCGNSGNTGWSTTCASTSEVPTGLADGYANSVPASQTFPASFIFSSQPSWYTSPYATVHWPAIGPDVTGGNAIAPNMLGTTTAPGGFAYPNPAELCYQNSPIDSNYPTALDRGMLLFNAATCYTATAPPPAPAQYIMSAVPLPADPAQPIITSVSPTKTYVTGKGCTQDGKNWKSPCVFALTCSANCFSTTQVSFDGTPVTQAYASGVMTVTVPTSLIPVPTTVTTHDFTAVNPAPAIPVLTKLWPKATPLARFDFIGQVN